MNEYLYLFRKIMNTNLKGYEEIRWRRKLTKKYSWAIPNEIAILTITKYAPLTEIGAGSGFWAMLLKSHGIDIIAYDLYPLQENLFHNVVQWFPIKKGAPQILVIHPKRNLILCWPPYNSEMAVKCLRWFRGDYIIYIGEGVNGCNATDIFFIKLKRDFELSEKIQIPQWWRVHDNLTVWKRKK